MTPYALRKVIEDAEREIQTDIQNAIFIMLAALLRHEADKETERNEL